MTTSVISVRFPVLRLCALMVSFWAPPALCAEPVVSATGASSVSAQEAVLPFPGGYFLPGAKTLAPGKFTLQVFATDRGILLKNGGKASAMQTVPLSQAENEKFSKQFECYQLCAGFLHTYTHYAPIANADWGMTLGPDGSVYLSGSPALSKLPVQNPQDPITLLPERIVGYLQGGEDNTVEPVYAWAGQKPIITSQGHIFLLGQHTLDQILGPDQIKHIPLPPIAGQEANFPPLQKSSQLSINKYGCIQIKTVTNMTCRGLQCIQYFPDNPVYTCVDALGRVIPDYTKLPANEEQEKNNKMADKFNSLADITDGTNYYQNIGIPGSTQPAPDGSYFYSLMVKLDKSGKKIADPSPSLYRFHIKKMGFYGKYNFVKFDITKPELLVRGNGRLRHWSFNPKIPDRNFSGFQIARNGDVYLEANYTIYKLTPKP